MRFTRNKTVANVGDGWFVATEKSDYILTIGLSSAKFQQKPDYRGRSEFGKNIGIYAYPSSLTSDPQYPAL